MIMKTATMIPDVLHKADIGGLELFYLEWLNNWLSTEKFAEHYGISQKEAIDTLNYAAYCRDQGGNL